MDVVPVGALTLGHNRHAALTAAATVLKNYNYILDPVLVSGKLHTLYVTARMARY